MTSCNAGEASLTAIGWLALVVLPARPPSAITKGVQSLIHAGQLRRANRQDIWRRKLAAGCISELLLLRSRVILGARSLYALDLRTPVHLELRFPKKVVNSFTVAGSRIAVVLGTDFQSELSAWNEASAFAGELVMVERGREFPSDATMTITVTDWAQEDPFLFGEAK